MHTQATAEVMIRLGNYRVWHPFPVSCVTNYFNKVFSSQRRGRLSKCVCALSDFICRRRMATWHTNCHGSLCVCVCVCVCSLLHVLSQVKSIQERPSGEVTWPEIGQIECIISGLWLVLFYVYLKQSLIFLDICEVAL